MDTKICKLCKENKPLFDFDKHSRYKDGFLARCRSCCRKYQTEWRNKNIDRVKIREKEYYKNNSDKIAEYSKEYSLKNKDKKAVARRLNLKKRRETDVLFVVKVRLRNRILSVFKSKGMRKYKSTEEILGVSFEVAKAHIERQFKKGMSWSNRGKWHIDHIVPLAIAKTDKEIIELCHYTNLQPLWANENNIKRAKIVITQLKLII